MLMHMCPRRYQTHTCAFAERGQRLMSGVFLNCSSFCFLRQGLPLNPVVTELVRMAAVSSRDPPASASPVLG